CLAEPAVLELKILQALHLLALQPAKLLAPPIIVTSLTPIWRIASTMFWPCETRTSTCRSFATISSGLYRFLAIAVLLDVKDIPQVGPLQWAWIRGAAQQPPSDGECSSSCSDSRGSRVQHIGSHPHSPGRCGRSPFMFTKLRTCQMSTLTPSLLAVLMMQFWTYFWRFRQCQLNFMPFASSLHAAVAFSRATLSALDIFAASAGVGTNAMPLTSTVAIMPAIKVVAKWYMIPSFD